MKRSLAFAIALICLFQFSGAQKQAVKYGAIGEVGLLNGDAGEELSLQVINGVSKGRWFAGIGTGIDYYFHRSVPVFLDVRRELTSNKNTPFVYANGGINFQWLTDEQKGMKFWPSEYKNGGYYDLGVGWKLKGKNDRAFLASVGYTYKQTRETMTMQQFWPVPTQLNQTQQHYNNHFRRIVIRIGFQL